MSIRLRIALAVLWVASLVAVRAWAQSDPRVISGGDIGFRVERVDSHGTPMGSVVVRVDGKWVEVGFASNSKLMVR
jgi:hypothetical protein